MSIQSHIPYPASCILHPASRISYLVSTIAFAITCCTCTTFAQPLKVYVLVGQSNMQGHGNLHTVPYMADDPETKDLHDKIVDKEGVPRIYENVRISAFSEGGGPQSKNGPLTMGYGANLTRDTVCGPELGFGITMGEKLGEPILLIKTAWGGKSLNTDFRPPGAGKYEQSEKIKELWAKHPDGAHGIPGKAKRAEWWEKKNQATGHYYRLMVKHVKEALTDIKSVYPDYDPKEGYELSGLVWFQGWNDMCDRGTYPDSDKPGGYAMYSDLMAQFIRDVRKDLKAPKMPFVIGVIGVGGDKATGGIANLRPAMAAPAGMDEFKGTVAAVQTGDFWDHEMEALQSKKGEADHVLRAAYMINEDGTKEQKDKRARDWKPLGKPDPEDRTWRFISVDPQDEKDKLEKKEKKRFREIDLPAELKDWYKPGFDDRKWNSGKAPVGKGTWKHRSSPEVTYNSEWGAGEFLLMRTTFKVKDLDHAAYRLDVLARQGFQIYLNGQKIHTYIWWKDEPFYRPIVLEKTHTKHLKKGENVLAAYANTEYAKKTGDAFSSIDLMIESISEKDLAYVESEEYLLKQMHRVCTPREAKIIRGSSNGGYHYLGSAKMLSQIGEAFAEAMIEMESVDK